MLENFLNAKPLYYETIDYTRMPRVYESIKHKLKLPKIIHLVGTNGKGTTGRFLASALLAKSYSVGHYTSPHIINFSERIWLNGESVKDELLNQAHKSLLLLLTKEDANSLSYFEYTTLLAILIYKDCDYVVLEAGLGGEHDATSVFDNILTLVTPIDIDHEAFLGNTIKEIATTKLKAVKTRAILATQVNSEVYEVADELQNLQNVKMQKVDEYLDDNDRKKIEIIARKNELAGYLKNNLSLSVAALNSLKIEYEVKDFDKSRLFGRLSRVNENIIVDVGHNILAAKSIYESLKEDKYTLVYNSYKDKNYKEILEVLKPIVLNVEIIDVDEERIESKEKIELVLKNLGLEHKQFKKIQEAKKYLVFGSFSVVEAFLKEYRG